MIITLLTDFGFSDPYVGSMKGVILGINSKIQIVDITHDITPQNVNEAAFVLKSVYQYFPKGTLHLVVVDPGVGSKREILAVKTNKYTFLAPDNGVLKYVYDDSPEAKVFRVSNQTYFLETVSQTFHGRDIFAPVAAHLSKGVSIGKMGEPFSKYVKGTVPKPVINPKKISGEIIYIDRFGNGITNIDSSLLRDHSQLKIQVKNWVTDRIRQSYQDVPVGEPLVIVGSIGTVEISVNQGSVKEKINLRIGDPVIVNFI